MKIGVITWFKYNNYGTKLQALAMQTYLKSKGHKPELVNFELPDSKNKKNNKWDIYDLSGRVLKKVVKMTNYKQINQKENNMPNIITNNCSISDYINNEKEYIDLCNSYDCLIFGSDQIWNPNWFHPYYFANYDSVKTKRIAYAPSIGVKSIPDNLLNDYKVALSRFNNIAMREKYAADIIKKITKKETQTVLDPVFLLNKDEWGKYESNDFKIDGPYILCYILTDNKNHWSAIKKYAKTVKKKLVVIPVGGHSYFSSKCVIPNCDAGTFLKAFDDADEVITDSFHGTVFSLIFNKKITVFERHNPKLSSSENSRIINILDMVGLSDRMVSFNSKIIDCTGKVDYKNINKILDKKIEDSKNYINKSIK